MATQSAPNAIDLQNVITGAARLELKALLAGVECLQVWIGQAARLSTIAGDTLQAIQHDKASLSETARRLTEFGKQNAEVFGDLASRLSKSYFDELGRLTAAVDKRAVKALRGAKIASGPEPARKSPKRGSATMKRARAKA